MLSGVKKTEICWKQLDAEISLVYIFISPVMVKMPLQMIHLAYFLSCFSVCNQSALCPYSQFLSFYQVCVRLDGLNAENTFHCWLYSV